MTGFSRIIAAAVTAVIVNAIHGDVNFDSNLPLDIPQPSGNECKLPSKGRGLVEGFNSKTSYAPSTGILTGAMFFVDFDDAPANDTTAFLHDTLLPHAVQWYNTSSYGRLDLQIKTDMSVFHRMPRNSTYYNWKRNGPTKFSAYIADAVKAIGTKGAFGNRDVLYIVPTSGASEISFSPTHMSPLTMADGARMRFIVTMGQDLHTKFGYKVLNHETGHTMGLPDLYPADNLPKERTAWVGGFDIMGWINGASPDLFAWHKWKLGWLDDDQVDCISKPGTSRHVISPVEVPGGVKAAAIRLNATAAFVVEVRSTLGVNKGSCSVGLVGYTISTTASNYIAPPIEVFDAHPKSDSCISGNRGGHLTSAGVDFSKGESSLESIELGIRIDVKGVKDGNYEVEIAWRKD